MKRLVALLAVVLSAAPVSAVTGPYLGQPSPGLVAQVFAPDLFTASNGWAAPILRPMWSPDGLEFFCRSTTMSYCYMQGLDGPWTDPVPISSAQGVSPGFQTLGWSMGPALSGDGQRICFMVDGSSGAEIWVSERSETGWSAPHNLQIPLPNAELWCISVTNGGTVYMTLGFEASQTYDLYRARPDESGAYPAVERLTPSIGARATFWQQIAPDESFLLLTQYNVSPGYGGYDIYVSFRDDQDRWTSPRNLGTSVNTGQDETEFFLTGDGKYLFFCRSSRIYANPSNVYWVEARAALPDPDGPIHNLQTDDRFGSVQCAIDYARAGDTLVIDPGLYQGSLDLSGKDLRLQSLDSNDPYYLGSTILQGTMETPVVTLAGNSDACQLAGLTIRAGAVGISGAATQATIDHCRILDNVSYGIELFDGSNPLLRHCLVTGNGQAGIMMHPKQGRYLLHCQPSVEDCVIVHNGQSSLEGGEPVVVDSILD